MTLKDLFATIPSLDYFEIVSNKGWVYNHKNSMVTDCHGFGFQRQRLGMGDDWGVYSCPVKTIETAMHQVTWGGDKIAILKITLDD